MKKMAYGCFARGNQEITLTTAVTSLIILPRGFWEDGARAYWHRGGFIGYSVTIPRHPQCLHPVLCRYIEILLFEEFLPKDSFPGLSWPLS